ncbi:hypothetical protein AX16_003648 [Volvariella volvacea WC 439]|nr:hypothetical protein AX16_003648 [Volvariella volvacea WC 439]
MANFLIGDELGNIKSINYAEGSDPSSSTVKISESPNPVQALQIAPQAPNPLVAAAYSNGTTVLFSLGEDNVPFGGDARWSETRFKPGQRFVGLAATGRKIYTCTSNGALRLTTLNEENEIQSASLGVLPTRLKDWRLSDDETTFAYGGEDVDLSVWDANVAFSSMSGMAQVTGAKRKRKDELFPGEKWRAKNVPNDNLGLRQPVRITSLAYLNPSDTPNQLVAGTELGNLRHYDTRTARRPIADYKGAAKVGGIKYIRRGLSPHQVFASDYGSNLTCIDTRNGRVAYAYKGIAASVSCLAVASPRLLASTSMDRYVRIHSAFPVPPQPGDQQEEKGQVLAKIYTTAVPTVITWNPVLATQTTEESDHEDVDDLWENMEHVEDESDEDRRAKRQK